MQTKEQLVNHIRTWIQVENQIKDHTHSNKCKSIHENLIVQIRNKRNY